MEICFPYKEKFKKILFCETYVSTSFQEPFIAPEVTLRGPGLAQLFLIVAQHGITCEILKCAYALNPHPRYSDWICLRAEFSSIPKAPRRCQCAMGMACQ